MSESVWTLAGSTPLDPESSVLAFCENFFFSRLPDMLRHIESWASAAGYGRTAERAGRTIEIYNRQEPSSDG